MGWLFGVSLFANIFCAAVNCYTWQLGYPLWRQAGAQFPAVHREYLARLTPVITVPHVVMFFASLGCVVWRPAGLSAWPAWIVFALDAVVILVSVAIAGPVHDRFAGRGFDEAGLRVLLRVSALRSGLMFVACGVLLWNLRGTAI